MTYLQLTAHLFLLVFWMRLWVKPRESFSFNPFLSGPGRLGDTVVAFLRPALGLSDRAAPLVLLAFLWVFQAMFFARFGKAWHLSFGMVQFMPPQETLAWGIQFAYSALHSAQFLVQAWTVYFFTRLLAPPNCSTRAQEAFAFFMNPFSRLPLLVQPLVLLALHLALAFAVIRMGALSHVGLPKQDATLFVSGAFTSGHVLRQSVATGCVAAMSFANGLETLIYSIIFFILGGLVMVLAGAQTLSVIFRESVDALMGRFARNPAATGGGLDFTPILFIFVVSFINGNVQVLLSRLLLMPLPFL